LLESTVQMTDSYYSARLQLDSAAAEVHHSSFTACNKARTHSLITDRVGSAHYRSVEAVSSGRTAIWLTGAQGRLDVLVFSLCVIALISCTRFLFTIANLLFSYSATQPLVCNKTHCV